jgi:hypothetical protein
MYSSGRPAILHEYRTSDEIRELFDQGVREREATQTAASRTSQF